MLWRLLFACLFALLASAGPVRASGDYGCGGPIWTLEHRDYGCAGVGMVAPGNDTRTNLILLLLDQRGSKLAGTPYSQLEEENLLNGRTFFNLWQLEAALFPEPVQVRDADDGSTDEDFSWSDTMGHCASALSGKAAFLAALDASRGVTPVEKRLLNRARDAIGCEYSGTYYDRKLTQAGPPPELSSAVSSASGKAFADYLLATHAFYSGNWSKAGNLYAGLHGATEPWVAEAADYMMIRVFLNAAAYKVTTENPSSPWTETRMNKFVLNRANAALDAYLKDWPSGRYAASARGLRRRILSFAEDRDGLADEYSALLARTPLNHTLPALLDEIDAHFFMTQVDANAPASAGGDPLLLAVAVLSQLREFNFYGEKKSVERSTPELAEFREAFKDRPDLYGFLQANYAYYVGKNYRRVLELLPDDARKPSYSSLEFSRQMLRGMALAALKDPNEEGFWRELLGGANQTWQRPVVEFGLALNFERRGRIAEVFAKDSPILDETIRSRLLVYSAGPEVLRAAAQDRSRPKRERDHALFAWAYRSLAHGRYAEFAAASRLIPANAPLSEHWLGDYFQEPEVPLGLFSRGLPSENIACPSLAQIATRLAARPKDNHAKLCLGDFWRRNGFDDFHDFNRGTWRYYGESKPDELGLATSQYPGKRTYRGQLYTEVIADPHANADDKAYALYRAVRCFSSTNDCFDHEVDQSVRRDWFRRLKRDYPNNRWAKQLEVYW